MKSRSGHSRAQCSRDVSLDTPTGARPIDRRSSGSAQWHFTAAYDVGVSTYAILNAAVSTSPIGAMRSAHDHQNHHEPSSAGAAYIVSDSFAAARLTTRAHSCFSVRVTRAMKPRPFRSAARASTRPIASQVASLSGAVISYPSLRLARSRRSLGTTTASAPKCHGSAFQSPRPAASAGTSIRAHDMTDSRQARPSTHRSSPHARESSGPRPYRGVILRRDIGSQSVTLR
jgi:hypothetical protein